MTRELRPRKSKAKHACGLSLFGWNGEVDLHVALDAPDQFKPDYELWTVRREGWLPEFELQGFERDRSPKAQVRLP
jgi:hypothetical protein